MRPAQIAQIAGECRRRRSSGRILKNATRSKGIAHVELGGAAGMNQHDGDKAMAPHQRAARIKIIAHGGEVLPRLQRQHEMVGAGMDFRRRQRRVELIGPVAEQSKRLIDEIRPGRSAAGGRRLQCGLVALPGGFCLDRDFGIVEPQRKAAIAGMHGQRRPKRDGRMAAERHFRFRREIADPPLPLTAIGYGEGGFGITDLGRDPAHLRFGRKMIGDHDAGGVAALAAIGESRDPLNSHDQSLPIQTRLQDRRITEGWP